MMIRWCIQCKYPTKNLRCSLCNKETIAIGRNAIPVFSNEKALLSYILDKNIMDAQVWNLGRNYYLIDGKRHRIDYSNIINNEKELKKARSFVVGIIKDCSDQDFDKFVKGNEDYLNKLIVEANNYINETSAKFENYLPVVSWSGGKDSIVVSDIVRKSLGTQRIIHNFGDTTLEFPTTYEYFHKFKEANPYVPFICSKSDKNFLDLCDIFGPPSRVMRWCCSIFKTGPISREFNKTISENILTFYGIRRSESFSRSKYKRTERSPKILRQIVSAPIIDWDDYDVWLYIISQDLTFNEAYRYGFRRVGCLYCPNNSMWSEFLMSIFFEDKYRNWKNYLYDFAIKIGKPDNVEYINSGNWKARQGGYGLDSSMVELENIDCNLHENAENYVFNKSVDKDIVEFFKPLGPLRVVEVEDEYRVWVSHLGKDDIVLHWVKGSSIVNVAINSDKDVYLIGQRIECQIRKYQACIQCSACDSVCPQGAINTSGGQYTVSDNCIHCGKCISYFTGGCLINKTLYKSKI